MTPLSGATGSTVSASGPAAPGEPVMVMWDGIHIATIPTVLDIIEFSGSFTVPADAAPGIHTITLRIPFDGTLEECPFTFTVEASVQTDAYTPVIVAQGETPTVLPSTGLMLLVPAAGLLAGGVGALILRKHRS
ncbi:MAG: hypothetical protein WC935_02465 [Thermoleophilia bacterium]